MRRRERVGTLVEVDEPTGIYRGEVYAIMGVLSDIDVNVRRVLRALGEETMKKKRKIFQTAEERAAWEAEGERVLKLLHERMRLIEVEFARRGKKLG